MVSVLERETPPAVIEQNRPPILDEFPVVIIFQETSVQPTIPPGVSEKTIAFLKVASQSEKTDTNPPKPDDARPAQRYFIEMQQFSLLTHLEEINLFWQRDQADRAITKSKQRIARSETNGKNDILAKTDLVEAQKKRTQALKSITEANLQYVTCRAKYFAKRHGLVPHLDDLIQQGNLVLLQTTQRYDWRQGNRFTTYLGKCLRHAFYTILYQNRQRDISLDEPSTTNENPFHENESITLSNIIPDTEENTYELATNPIIKSEIETWLKSRLTAMEYEILSLRFGLEGEKLRTKEISEKFGFNHTKIWKIEKRALSKLAKDPKAKQFLESL